MWRNQALPFARRVERALRVYGPAGTARRGWRALRSLPVERRLAERDRFDEETGVVTAGVVRLESLSVPAENRRLGHRYQPSDPETLRRTIAALPIRHEEFAFVDVGSGKGRALLVASEFPFERILGVELSEELNEIALRNIEAYSSPAQRCRTIEAVCADAAEYELPGLPLVLYFYNPFLEPVMRRVMANVGSSLAARPRPAYVVLTQDTPLGAIVVEAGFVRCADLAATTTDAIYVSVASAPGP
jgi:hypothetical protein